MEAIVQKVSSDLHDLARAYTTSGHENVTLDLIKEFKHSLFIILDEFTRISDLEQSDELRVDIIELFRNELPTAPGWPYLNQSNIPYGCFAEKGCKLRLGSALYQCSFCNHFMCEKHISSPCIVHKSDTGEKAPKKKEEESMEQREAGDIALNTRKDRVAKFQVEDVSHLSAKDFNYKEKDYVQELHVCQVRNKMGELIWLPVAAYLELKNETNDVSYETDSDDEGGIIGIEDTNRQNINATRNDRRSSELQVEMRPEIPTKIWDAIQKHPTPELRCNVLWHEIFKDERWLNNVTTNNAHPGLLGQNLNRYPPERGRSITLLLYNGHDVESKSLFFESLRRHKIRENGYEVDIGNVCLNIGVIKGYRYLDSRPPEGSEYCFWTDISRELKLIKTEHVTSGLIPQFFGVKMSLATEAKTHEFKYMFSNEDNWMPE